MPPSDRRFLEGLCAPPPGAVRKHGHITVGAGGDGVERIEARFAEKAFSPHRHDSYAIGVTLAGVQSFRYRGEQRHCLPGQCLILHPDELHDGEPGTEDGFRYRIVYIDPALVQQALDGSPLPFVADPVLRTPGIGAALLADALDMEDTVDELRRVDIGTALARLLRAASGAASGADRTGTGLLDLPALLRVRERIAADPRRPPFRRRAGAPVRPRPLDARPAVPRRLRHQPQPLPHHAPARPGTAADDRRHTAGRSGAGGRIRRPEPSVAPVQTRLWHDAGPLARGSGAKGGMSTRRMTPAS